MDVKARTKFNFNKSTNGKIWYFSLASIAMLVFMTLAPPLNASAGPYVGGYPNKGVQHNIYRSIMDTDLGGTNMNALDCVIKSVLSLAGTSGSIPSGWSYQIGMNYARTPTCGNIPAYGAAAVFDLASQEWFDSATSPYNAQTLDDVQMNTWWTSDKTQTKFMWTYTDVSGFQTIKTRTYNKQLDNPSVNFMNGVTFANSRLMKFM